MKRKLIITAILTIAVVTGCVHPTRTPSTSVLSKIDGLQAQNDQLRVISTYTAKSEAYRIAASKIGDLMPLSTSQKQLNTIHDACTSLLDSSRMYNSMASKLINK
jgi:hypothetical protein